MSADLLHVRPDYGAQCWTVSLYVRCADAGSGYRGDPETLALFGTETLPTPFTLQAPEGMVLAELRRLNPDADVVRV